MDPFWKHFQFSEFQWCISFLEESVDLSEKFSLDIVDVSNKFNLQLCKLLQSVVRQKSDGDYGSDLCLIIQNGENATHDILTKVKSFLPTQEWIGLELTLLYNLMCFRLLLGNLKKDTWSFMQKRSTNLLKQSLNRVKKALKVVYTVSSVQDSYEDIVELIEKLVSYKHLLKVNNIVDSFCLVSCIHALGLMHCGNTSGALSCLEALEPLVTYDTDLLKLHPQIGLLAFSHDRAEETITDVKLLKLTDIIKFSLGVCFFKLNQGQKCRTVLEKVTHRLWKHHATYLVGRSLLHDKLYAEALNCVSGALCQDADCSGELRAKLLNLQGTCFFKLNLYHSAIAAFKEALELDFTFVMPLYNISLQYKQLGMLDEELEALNLLITILEDKASNQSCSTQIGFCSLFIGHLPDPSVSLLQALYVLASRCMHLSRFSEASEKYLDFLAEVDDPSHLCLQENEACVIKLPQMVTVYNECAFCLLMSGQFHECLAICTRALDTYSDTVFVDDGNRLELREDCLFADSDVPVQNTDKTFQCRKRPRSDSCEHAKLSSENESWKAVENHMQLVFYKADALVQLSDLKSAADLLHRSIEHLQDFNGHTLTDRENSSHVQVDITAVKKRRTNDGKVINAVNTDAKNCVSSTTRGWEHVLGEACTYLATILTKMDKLSDTLHYCRLAIQLDSENTKAWHMCCLVLQKTGRQYESVSSWLRHRHICHQSDAFQLASELKRTREQLRMVTVEDCEKKTVLLSDSILPCEFLKMDISSLEHLLKCQQSKQFAH